MAVLDDPTLLNDGTEVEIAQTAKRLRLNVAGNLSAEGVVLQTLYAFLKHQWIADPHVKALPAYPFPMKPITDKSFELVEGWDFFDDATRQLIRNGGWSVVNASSNSTQIYTGVVGLGTIDAAEQPYYNQGQGRVNFARAGQVNEAVQVVRDDDGDGNFAEGADFDRRSQLDVFVRRQGRTYAFADLTSAGVSTAESDTVLPDGPCDHRRYAHLRRRHGDCGGGERRAGPGAL